MQTDQANRSETCPHYSDRARKTKDPTPPKKEGDVKKADEHRRGKSEKGSPKFGKDNQQ